MALALKCDRCGSYYDWYDWDKDGHGHPGNSVRITVRGLDKIDLAPDYKSQDLCPECMSALQTFMRLCEIKENCDE